YGAIGNGFWQIFKKNRRRRKRRLSFVAFSDIFLDLGSLAGAAAEIVKLCPSHLARTDDGDIGDLGGVQREAALHTDAEGKTAHREALADPAVLLGDDDALEVLDPFLAALDDAVAHLDGVADVELGHVLLEPLALDRFNETFH